MTDTYGGRTTFRSSKLKRVDLALKKYHSQPLRTWGKFLDLKNTLVAWQDSKGTDKFGDPKWQSSIRNKRKAASNLALAVDFVADHPAEISDVDYHLVTSNGIWVNDPDFDKEWQAQEADREAHAFIEQHREQALNLLFQNARIRFKSLRKDEAASDIYASYTNHRTWSDLHRSGTDVTTSQGIIDHSSAHFRNSGGHFHSANTQWNNLGTHVFGAADWGQAVTALGQNTLFTELSSAFSSAYTAMIPFIGLAKSGFDGIKGFAMAAYKEYELADQKRHAAAVLGEGDPRVAFQAMTRLIRHEIHDNLIQGTRGFTALGSKILCMFFDAGIASTPAIAIVEGIAKVMQKLYILKRSYNYMKAGNTCLEMYRGGHPVSREIFEDSPILGCYFLVNANTSDLLDWLTIEFGDLGWQTEAEARIKTDLQQILLRANSAIQDSQIEVVGIPTNKGSLMYQGIDKAFDKITKLATYTSKGGLASAGLRYAFRDRDADAARQERQRQTQQLKARLKGRITGFGNSSI